MLIKNSKTIPSSEITDEKIFKSRRKFISAAVAVAGVGLFPVSAHASNKPYAQVPDGPYSAPLQPTAFEDVSSYTNYYEFTTNKTDSTRLAQALTTSPWQVTIEGEVDKPGEWTRLTTSEIEFDIDLQPGLFTLSNLRNPRQ